MAIRVGTDGPDSITGTADEDIIRSLGGDDVVTITATNGTVEGGPGNDLITGTSGGYLLYGDNRVDGPLPVAAGYGGPPPGNNTIYGGTGSDVIYAGFGADTVYGNDGNDIITGGGSYTGNLPSGGNPGALPNGDGGDLLYGGNGDDLINGMGGNDTLYGDAGNDTLAGGLGLDVLSGGPGADVFWSGYLSQRSGTEPLSFFPTNDRDSGVGEGNRDIITDYVQGEDRLNPVYYVAATDAAPPQGIAFLGTNAFRDLPLTGPGVVGPLEIRYFFEGDHTVVQFYAPGLYGKDLTVDMELQINGHVALTAADFAIPVTDLGAPETPAPVDWNALAAQVTANFAATGQWFAGDGGGNTSPPPGQPVDWNALAAQVVANFAATGQWFA